MFHILLLHHKHLARKALSFVANEAVGLIALSPGVLKDATP